MESKEKVKSSRIITIERTYDQIELAEIYSAADIFLNTTREDNYPTVNLEALACGTPVLSYGAGGSAEAFDCKCGRIVNDNNVVEVIKELYINNYKSNDCANKGRQFDENEKFKEYLKLYDLMLEG